MHETNSLEKTKIYIYHKDLSFGDIIRVKKQNPRFSNIMLSYGLFEELRIDELEKNKNIGVVIDQHPYREMLDTGKVEVFIDNEYLYLHYSDFEKIELT
jgi:hypothetical protein